MVESKIKPVQSPSKNKKVTLRLFSKIKQELPSKILMDGYNMREKSKWIVEAIRSLMSKPGWESVLVSEISVKPDAQDLISIPTELVKQMDDEIHRIALGNASLRPNRSAIIRAAINRRLLGIYKTNKE